MCGCLEVHQKSLMWWKLYYISRVTCVPWRSAEDLSCKTLSNSQTLQNMHAFTNNLKQLKAFGRSVRIFGKIMRRSIAFQNVYQYQYLKTGYNIRKEKFRLSLAETIYFSSLIAIILSLLRNSRHLLSSERA